MPEFQVGDRVRVLLSNGYAALGVVVKVYKNGAVRVREVSGRAINRSPKELTKIE